jgi:exodeoxyribonuclease V gamma subunit
MASLHLHTSNRLRSLAEELARLLAEPAEAVLRKEVVVVPSLGMRRWLSLEIARVNRVCANVLFPFVSDFINSLPPDLSTTAAKLLRRDPEEMTWAVHRILPGLLGRREFSAVQAYLSDSDPLKLFQLSERIAQLFDQYLVYRPAMMARWADPKIRFTHDEAWQAALWRAVDTDKIYSASRAESEKTQPANHEVELPQRIFVFGITALPPIYLEAFFDLARSREAHLFLLRPSNQYHGDDLTPKQRARRKIASTEASEGNPLLTSLGRQGSYLTELLIDTDERLGPLLRDASETFIAAAGQTLLATLQSDILNAENRGQKAEAGGPAERIAIDQDDRSLLIHSCHSPMREVEVLYDQLLDMFVRDSTLRPRDILVMIPEIEKYSPLIHAVFEYPEDPARKIPYSISDRHPRIESVVIDTFLKLLELPTGRCTAQEIFGFISSPVIQQRFEFSEDDLALIRTWIENTNIAWGIDGDDRERMGLPALQANTWRFGLDRLLLGYAMRGNNRRLYDGVLPYDEVEGDGGELLGRFVSVAEKIFALVEQFRSARPLSEWLPLMRGAVDDLLESEDEENVRDLRFLRRTISNLGRSAENTGAVQDVEFGVLRHHLTGLLGAMEQRGGFLTGGVTFCALKPARSIPARVICLLGMSDEVFPRRPQFAQFDLMAKRKLGDPSQREDDRYAFLETIISAHDRLHISYVGRSIVENSEIPPSVVINELLDYLNEGFTFPRGKTAREYLVLEHPLQAFSPRYFDNRRRDQRLFSYSETNAVATRAASIITASGMSPFLKIALPQPDTTLRTIELTELVRFLYHPTQYFLKARMGLQLGEWDTCLPDDEPIELNQLEKYSVRQELLTERIDTATADLQVFAARGNVPPGTIGQLQLRSFDREAERFASVVRPFIGEGKKGEPITIDIRSGEFSVTGRVETIYGDKVVHYRCAKLNLRDRLRAWVDHLAVNATSGATPTETLLIGMDEVMEWQEIREAKDLLQDLCALYWEGLARPAPLFPRSAFAFVEAELSGHKDSLKKARSVWEGGYQMAGEKDEEAIALIFREGDPLDEEFTKLARREFGPLLQHAGRRFR